MTSNWINALDFCAMGGVLDYDAAADLLDQPQRFVGHPKICDIPAIEQPLLLPPNTKLKGQLTKDSYGSIVENPSWKKWLMGGILVVGPLALFLTHGKWGSSISARMNKSGIMNSIKNFGKTIWNGIKKPFKYIKSKI